MYASHFGLHELPFNNTPDPRYFYSTPDHEEALASLVYAIQEGKGFVLLTGEVGSGKTLVTRLMLKHFGDSIAFANINNMQFSGKELLRNVCAEFDINVDADDQNTDLMRALQDSLIDNFARNRHSVLMLDEAQSLSREAFEQVRMIGNLEADDAKLLQIVIVGQPELRQRFEAHDMRQLRQRLFRSFHLASLGESQIAGYIRHRLSVAGANHPENVFDERAIRLVARYSEGLPRLINTLCDNAMLSAYASDRDHVDASILQQVIEDMMRVPRSATRYTAELESGRGSLSEEIPVQSAGTQVAPATDAATRSTQQHFLDVAAMQIEPLLQEHLARLRKGADDVEQRMQQLAREYRRAGAQANRCFDQLRGVTDQAHKFAARQKVAAVRAAVRWPGSSCSIQSQPDAMALELPPVIASVDPAIAALRQQFTAIKDKIDRLAEPRSRESFARTESTQALSKLCADLRTRNRKAAVDATNTPSRAIASLKLTTESISSQVHTLVAMIHGTGTTGAESPSSNTPSSDTASSDKPLSNTPSSDTASSDTASSDTPLSNAGATAEM